MINKRAQGGLSINVIIVAIIALVVLVVLVFIFTDQIGNFINSLRGTGDAAKTCNEQKGELMSGEGENKDCPENYAKILSSDAASSGQICCKPK